MQRHNSKDEFMDLNFAGTVRAVSSIKMSSTLSPIKRIEYYLEEETRV